MSSSSNTASIRHQIALFPWLSDLSAETLDALAQHLTARDIPAGAELFRSGEVGEHMYFVSSGQLAVYYPTIAGADREVARIGWGEIVGEMALLTGGPRTASVRAIMPSQLLELSRQAFDRTRSLAPGFTEVLARIVMQRLSSLKLFESGFLAGLSDSTLRLITRVAEWQHILGGQWLYHAGEPIEAVYLLVHGRVALIGAGHGPLAMIEHAEVIGEFHFDRKAHYRISARALRNSDVLRIPVQAFMEAVEVEPATALQIYRTLGAKSAAIRAGHNANAESQRNARLALLCLKQATEDSLIPLADALAAGSRVLQLDANTYEAIHGAGSSELPEGDPRHFFLRDWLEEQEAVYDQVLLIGEINESAWTKTIIKQADRIIALLPADAISLEHQLNELLTTHAPATAADLVVVHAAATMLGASLRWRHLAPERRLNHLRRGNRQDLERLVRILRGSAVGLVLGAGGARAFAHLGVYRALSEHGIPVDYVGGASMGALIASLIAADLPIHECREILYRMLVCRPHGLNITLPLVSLMSVKRAEQRFHHAFGETPIESLWRTCFCVSVDLITGAEIIHQDGPIWRAVRASIAIPGIFPPLFSKDSVLVDGALLNSLPVEVMSSICPGPIIAVDVNRTDGFAHPEGAPESPNVWQLLLGRLGLGPARRAPSLGNIMIRALEVTTLAAKRRNAERAHLYLTPPVSRYRILDMTPLDALIEAGYRYACETLAAAPSFRHPPF